jgi:predicted lactoylglutathione lyase
MAVGEARDYGFMYQRAFADPDGHVWAPFWMDPEAMPSQQSAEGERR